MRREREYNRELLQARFKPTFPTLVQKVSTTAKLQLPQHNELDKCVNYSDNGCKINLYQPHEQNNERKDFLHK